MVKYKVLGVVNGILAILFVVTIVTSGFNKEILVLIFSVLINAILAYRLLVKKENKQAFKLYLVPTCLSVVWFLILFLGYFFAFNPIFSIGLLVLIIGIYYFLGKTAKRIATALVVITLLVSGAAVIANFEEDYCWGKGTEADKAGSKVVMATKEDAEKLKEFRVKEGTQIGASFRTHMLCHTTFNFIGAVRDRYLLGR